MKLRVVNKSDLELELCVGNFVMLELVFLKFLTSHMYRYVIDVTKCE